MMFRGNVGKVILAAIICAAALYLIIPLDFMLKEEPRSLAFIPHEDPETAEPVFSGTSILMFDADYLNFILQMNPEEVAAMLRKWPLSHISQSIKEATSNFFVSGMSLSHLLVEIDEDTGKLRALREQFRLGEAAEQAAQTSARLAQANNKLEKMEQAIEIIDKELEASSAPAGSDLRRAYDAVLEGIDGIREMLILNEELLKSMDVTLEELLKSMDVTLEELLKSTDVTLEVQPLVAFIGDDIPFKGVLVSEGNPLAGREVDVLADGSRYVTVKTDAYGRYQGTLQVPPWYIPELDLQALYYPKDEDTGVYLTSLSPVVTVKVLFYAAGLEVTVEDKAYPGLETTVNARFDYGQSPPLKERNVEIYLDDVFITEFLSQEGFTQKIKIDPQTDVGKHVITVSSAAVGRYSPVAASIILNVTRAVPILDLSMPGVAMIPGSVGLEGKLYSEVGPLSEASIKMGLGKSRVESVSSEDGAFDTKIKVGMGFGVIGSQDLVVQVLPQEPWHAPLTTTSSILMVNVVNCGALVAVLLFLGLYLPGRLRRRLGVYPRRTARPAIAVAQPEPATTYSERVTTLTATKEADKASAEPRDRIFYWYRLVVRLLQRITKAFPGPQQTLREFARESGRVLGPAAEFFMKITRIVESLLYSPYRPTEKDVENSRQLTVKIEEETKIRVTAQFPGEGTEAEFGLGGRVSTTSPWRQLPTWLWILLILAIVYFACILLFVLPLLVVYMASCLPLVIVDDLREMGTKTVNKEEAKSESV